MGKVLYEVRFYFDLFMLIPIILFVFFYYYPELQEKLFAQNGQELTPKDKQFSKAFSRFACVFSCLIGLALFGSQIVMYSEIMQAYDSGSYEIVEGYVENFDPMPFTGHGSESFEIEGVYFSYSDFEFQQGYHNAKSHGGVISGDGQYLKIKYVELYSNSSYKNIILYIEELPSPS